MAKTAGTFGGFNFDPEVFGGYIAERDPVNSKLIDSGIVVPAPQGVANLLSDKNNVVTIPFYVPFEGDAKNYDGKTDNTPQTLSGKKMTGMAYRRMQAWTEDDFTHELTGANDLSNVAANIGNYQAKQNQKTLLSIFKGLEGVETFGSHVNDLALEASGEVTDANKLNSSVATTAMQKALGDHLNELKVWFMHSAVHTDLAKQGLINDIAVQAGIQEQDPFKGYFLNRPVIVDDTMTAVANETSGKTEYHTYLCGTGLIMTCPARIDVPNAVTRDEETKGGRTALYNKWGRLLHPYGFSFVVDNTVEESPTNAEFAAPANWVQKYSGKNIPLVAFITNVSE